MHNLLALAWICVLISGCSTLGNSFGRTSYASHSLFQGYSDIQISPDLRVARFVGNPHTSHREIALMSAFRAVEICRTEKYRLADIYDTRIPSSGGEIKAGYRPYVDTQETVAGYGHVPMDTYFACRNETFLLGIAMKPVPPSEIAPYVKDSVGAVRVEGFVMFSPNQSRLKTDDIIFEIDGRRISNMADIKSAVAHAANKERIPAKVVSDKRVTDLELKSADATVQVSESQDAMVKALCRDYPGTSDRPICGAKVAK